MEDFQDAAKRHLDDANLLFAHRSPRLANASHLFGISAECSLKAIARHFNPIAIFYGNKGHIPLPFFRVVQCCSRVGWPCCTCQSDCRFKPTICQLERKPAVRVAIDLCFEHCLAGKTGGFGCLFVDEQLFVGADMNPLANLLDWDTVEKWLINALESHSLVPRLQTLVAGESIVLVRNWYGQLMLLLPCTRSELERSECMPLVEELRLRVGSLALPTWVMCRDELFGANSYWSDPALLPLLNEPVQLMLLERQERDRDWLLPVPKDGTSFRKSKRCVFFSIKGGVGRSSALAMLAIELARRGKRVLVVDGDFESPGLSSSLLPRDEGQPAYGVVDWLTAQALGADAEMLQRMALEQVVEHSPLNSRLALQGQLLVAPAYGQKTQAYVAKLARLYRQSPDGKEYAQRLNEFLATVEAQHGIEVTLFDSRAGIDETSAAAVTQLKADVSFLFAINTRQTWDAYRLLFQHLRRNLLLFQTSSVSGSSEWDLRESLHAVSALTPQEAGAYVGYFESLQENSYDTFSEIYDEDDGSDLSVFAPAPDAEDAPHSAAKVMWNDALRAFNPLGQPDLVNEPIVHAAFLEFLNQATALLGVDE